MKNLKIPFLLACLCTYFAPAFSQSFGGHPTGLKWQVIKTDAVRVIYPQGMDAQAQRAAKLINYMDVNNRRSIGDKKRRFDLVIQNQTTNPNGYVGLAPLRSEFFSTPPQSTTFLGSLDWLDLLAIHEYRHVQQNLNAKRGLTKFFYLLQGETSWAVFSHFSIPNWYWEGDAVVTETALSNAGRGRAPFFTLQQRALAAAGKNYAYGKHRNGSFKDLLPDHYRLGYMMLTHTRNKFGNDITKDIMQDAARYRGIIYPFSRAMKRHTGMGTWGMYREAWETKKTEWAEQLKNADLQPTTPVTKKQKRTVTNYHFPRHLEDGSIVALKSSYKKTGAVVQIKDGEETKITTVGFHIEPYLNYGGGKLAWTEISKNARWGNQDFSDIILYDLKKGERKKLTQKTKYFSPAVSPDGQSLAVVHISPLQENRIHLLDPNTGQVTQKIDNPKNLFLSHPAWTEDGGAIVCVAKLNSQLSLVKFDLSENTMTELLPWTAHTLDVPFVRDGKVFFNASFSGIDNIFYTDLDGSKNIYQVTSVPIGAFDPGVSPDGKEVVFTEFTEMGYVVSKQVFDQKNAKKINIIEPVDMPIFQTVANETEGGSILGKTASTEYRPENYRGIFNGLKLHSWGFSPSISAPSLQLQMTNILNDLTISAGGGINRNEDNANFYKASVDFARWFPVISLNAGRSERETDFFSPADTLTTQHFNENVVGGSVAVPLSWLHGNFATSLRMSGGLSYRHLSGAKAEGRAIPDRDFSTYDLGLSLSSIRRRARQNVGPRAGLSANVNYTQSLNGADNERIVATGTAYLPGLMPNHNIKIKAGYQKELLSNPYQFTDRFEYTRGYETPVNDDFTSLSVNYGLPLFYPDFGIAGIVYFKRVRANVFYDAGVGNIKKLGQKTDYRSWGFEIIFDNRTFNLLSGSFGFRQSFLLEDDPLNPGVDSAFEFFVVGAF